MSGMIWPLHYLSVFWEFVLLTRKIWAAFDVHEPPFLFEVLHCEFCSDTLLPASVPNLDFLLAASSTSSFSKISWRVTVVTKATY